MLRRSMGRTRPCTTGSRVGPAWVCLFKLATGAVGIYPAQIYTVTDDVRGKLNLQLELSSGQQQKCFALTKGIGREDALSHPRQCRSKHDPPIEADKARRL